MSQQIFEILVNKLDGMEKDLQQLKAEVQAIDRQNGMEEVKGDLKNIKVVLTGYTSLKENMTQLSRKLDATREIMMQPRETKVTHHHHLSKIIYVITFLITSVAVMGMGWWNAHHDLANFKANDTKYRLLKLKNNVPLQTLLLATDSLYRIKPNLRDSVLYAEERLKEKLQMLSAADENERTARELRRKAGKY